MYIRFAEDRGFSSIQNGDIESFYTFSFSSYWDKNHTGFSSLKVLNDDVFKPLKGFLRIATVIWTF
ncbi:MAG: redox-sensitive bicupin YhaK (pirin superfamily) [Alphaproteobacteria bacterium]|jgi:redox-sensitive bicupin YhaK (pirin superfamily)